MNGQVAEKVSDQINCQVTKRVVEHADRREFIRVVGHLLNTYQGQVRGPLYRLLGSDPDVNDMGVEGEA